MMDKKGQGISITVIIVAAIALVVLVILIVMFVGRIGIFGEKVEKVTEINCAQTCFTNNQGYKVYGRVEIGSDCGAGMHTTYGAYDDVGPGELCCVDDTIDADECG
jgi:hypothetical protein